MTACTPKDVAYFQDKRPGTQALMDTMFNVTSIPFKLRPGDKISINVSSRNSTLSQQFNMGGGQYLIDDNGNIDFPVLGEMRVAGLDRKELKDSLTNLSPIIKTIPKMLISISRPYNIFFSSLILKQTL